MASPSGYSWTKDKLRVAKIFRGRGNAAFQQSQWKSAIVEYNNSLNALPPLSATFEEKYTTSVKENLVFALVNRALCYQKTKEWQKSINDCTRVLSWDENNEKALFRRAKALYEQNRNQESFVD